MCDVMLTTARYVVMEQVCQDRANQIACEAVGSYSHNDNDYYAYYTTYSILLTPTFFLSITLYNNYIMHTYLPTFIPSHVRRYMRMRIV